MARGRGRVPRKGPLASCKETRRRLEARRRRKEEDALFRLGRVLCPQIAVLVDGLFEREQLLPDRLRRQVFARQLLLLVAAVLHDLQDLFLDVAEPAAAVKREGVSLARREVRRVGRERGRRGAKDIQEPAVFVFLGVIVGVLARRKLFPCSCIIVIVSPVLADVSDGDSRACSLFRPTRGGGGGRVRVRVEFDRLVRLGVERGRFVLALGAGSSSSSSCDGRLWQRRALLRRVIGVGSVQQEGGSKGAAHLEDVVNVHPRFLWSVSGPSRVVESRVV